MTGAELFEAASEVLGLCGRHRFKLATAESCTGGMIAAAFTASSGSSVVFDRGYVTYSNAAKIADLGVPAGLIEQHGAVSEEVARAMAEGACERAEVNIALAVTGIAGPTGGTPQKPVGLVHIAVAHRGGRTLHRECRFGPIGRGEVRRLSAMATLALAKELLSHL
jgi:nicotinamide-nucleotide amidase